MGKMDYPPKSGDEETPQENSRRKFLKKLGLFAGATVLAPNILAETKTQKESSLEIKDGELKKMIEEYVNRETFLSKEDIKESLKKCGFIDNLENLNIIELDIKNPQEMYSDKDALKEALKNEDLVLNNNELNIIQVDFDKIGGSVSGAYYLDEYKSILVNQSKDDKKTRKEKIENFIIDKVVSIEFSKVLDMIENSNLSDEDKNKQKEDLHKWLVQSHKEPKKIKHLNKLIKENIEEIKKSVEKFSSGEIVNREVTETNIPHEAFHYFYMNGLGEREDNNPSIEELLAMAIKGKIKRFGKDDPSYATISFLIEDLDVDDPEKLLEFCKKVNSENALVSKRKEYSKEEFKLLSDNKKEKYILTSRFSKFLDEYLARIYNGAIGNTPSFVKTKMDNLSKRGITIPDFDYEDIYHEPTNEEISLLRKIEWHGKSIIRD